MKGSLSQKGVITIVILIFIVFLAWLFFIPLVFAAIAENHSLVTSLNISYQPPIFLGIIPNFTLFQDENSINAFDLDDYFFHPAGYSLNFSNSSVDNVTIIIDSENRVSFYPDLGFAGNVSLLFYGSDGISSTPSNLIYLFIGNDNQPPLWSRPSKNKNRIFQNTIVNFTASWTDNIELEKYIFNIVQGGTTFSSSWVDFSGKSNTSFYSFQISAAGGTNVSWRFCAEDTSSNQNCTNYLSFSVFTAATPSVPAPSLGSGEGSGSGDGGFAAYVTQEKASVKKDISKFSVDPEFFKISLKQGSTETRILTISNLGNYNISFNLSAEGVGDFILLSEESFVVPYGSSKKITIDFTALRNTSVEEYFGKILVLSSAISLDELEIPVVIDVNAVELGYDLDVKILEEYLGVRPGEEVRANITIRNLKDIEPTNLNLYLAIKDLNGNIYDSLNEEIAFSSTMSFERSFILGKELNEGEHLFYGRVSKEDLVLIDSDLFLVGIRFNFGAFFKSSFIFLLIAILSILAILLMIKYQKERRKERILSLYLMVSELKNMISEGKFDSAVNLYIRIKAFYGEPISKSAIQNKENLKKEVEILSRNLKNQVKKIKKEEGADDGNGASKKNDSSKSNAKSTSKPAVKSAAKFVAKKPVAKPASKSVAKSVASKPAIAKPGVAKSAVAKSAAKPAVKPVAAKPVANPAAAKPAASNPAVAKSAASKPATAKPPVAKSAVAKSAVSKPVAKPIVKSAIKKEGGKK